MHDPTDTSRSWRSRAWALTKFLLALALVGSAVVYALRDQSLDDWMVFVRADPLLLCGLIVTVAMSSIVIPGLQFWLVTQPFAVGSPIGIGRMQSVVAASVLLNYTPFKAGLAGRVLYLRRFHGVGYRAAVLTHGLIGATFVVCCLLSLLLFAWRARLDVFWWLGSALGIVVLSAIGSPVLRFVLRSGIPFDQTLGRSRTRRLTYLAGCLLLQFAGLSMTAARWWLAFRIFDRPLSLVDSWVAATVHMFAVMAGPANGLGLREWLIGMGAQRGWTGSGPIAELGSGVVLALADRAVEAAVVIVVGLLSLLVLRRVANRETGGLGPDRLRSPG